MIPDASFALCLLAAAERYEIEYPLLHAIYVVEAGEDGLARGNSNGTEDLGRLQINTLWVPEIAAGIGGSEEEVYRRLRDDGCYNASVGAWLLKVNQVKAGDYWTGVGHYHSRTPSRRDGYIKRVVEALKRLYGDRIFVRKGDQRGSRPSSASPDHRP